MTQALSKPKRWLLAVDPRIYHWDTLFVKGKEMWRQAGSKPDALRNLKLAHKGDRALCYHGKPEHAVYALAEVSHDPYPDPHDSDNKKYVVVRSAGHGAAAAAGEAGGVAREQAAAKN